MLAHCVTLAPCTNNSLPVRVLSPGLVRFGVTQVVQDVPLQGLGCVLGSVHRLRAAGAVYGLVGAAGKNGRVVRRAQACWGKGGLMF